jgi:hypothetical protein
MATLGQPLKTRIRRAIQTLTARGGRWETSFAARLAKILRASEKKVVGVIRANVTSQEYNWIQARARGLRVAAKALRKQRREPWARAAGRDLRQDVAALRDIQTTIRHLWNAAKGKP